MREADDLEAARQAVGEAAPHEQRRRAEDHDPQRRAGGAVLVPQLLHHVRPVADLLDLVEDEQAAGPTAHARLLATDRPLRVDPADVLGIGSVGGGEVARNPDGVHHLARDRRLADLARPGEDLDELARLVGASQDLVVDRPTVLLRPLRHLLTISSAITQHGEQYYSADLQPRAFQRLVRRLAGNGERRTASSTPIDPRPRPRPARPAAPARRPAAR